MLATAQKFNIPKLKKTNSKTENNNTMKHQIQPISKYLTLILVLTISTASCKTCESPNRTHVANILNAQAALIEAIEAERHQGNVKQAISKSDDLMEAERHLQRALLSIKGANRKLMEHLKNERESCK